MVGLVDCNNFFVSCERTLDPSLEGRAVVVLSNNDGCVVARSNEAKLLGIRMGQPAFEIKLMIMRGDVIALSGNHLLYRAVSLRMHDIFRRYAPRTIDYSIDEAFLDMDGIPQEALMDIGNEICRVCREQERIPVTVGFAPTKTLAKVATEVGKKNARSVVTLFDVDERARVLDALPIGDLWGIGRRLAKKLYLDGVYTAGDFMRRPLMWVRARLGVNGERSWRELHGESCIDLSRCDRETQDSISETRTFPCDIDDFDYLRARISNYCSHVARRLRAMHAVCREISVFLRTNRFHTERGYRAPSASSSFPSPTDSTSVIAGYGIALLESIYDPAFAYKRAGVVLTGITPLAACAPTIFDDVDPLRQYELKSRKLMKAIDSINPGVGAQLIRLATELNSPVIGHNDGYSSSFGAPDK